MKNNMPLEQALLRVKQLEEENTMLKERVAELEERSVAGRKKHDKKWRESYDEWVKLYESGKTIMEIVESSDISRRTCYRYKSYYDSLKNRGEL